MPVTEFAILTTAPSASASTPASLPPAFLSAMRTGQTIQSKWYAASVPSADPSIPARGTWAFQQLENPSICLLTARWTDIPEHFASIASAENQALMAEIAATLDPSTPMVLQHLEGDLFAAQGEGTPLLESPVFSVARMPVVPEKRAQFEEALEGVKGILAEAASPHRVRGGWRVDGEEGAPGEFVLFCGWESREAQGEFARTEDGRRFGELDGLVEGKVDVKHYKRVL